MEQSPVRVTGLACEYQVNPLGLETQSPRLSWRLESSERAVRQTAYQVLVTGDPHRLAADTGDLWDSGQVLSDHSLHQAYAGQPLQSGQRCYWKVRVSDAKGQVSAWSEPAEWEMGLLKPSDWQAAWIQPNLPENPALSTPAPMLRATFTLDGAVRTARAYVTSLGLYEMMLNGQRVGDWLFTPGWTSYHKRLQYQTYDVTAALTVGRNAVGVTLGDGWYRGHLGWGGRGRAFYGEKLALLAQIVITDADGRVQVVGTGPNWKAATGPILKSDIYNGEDYDARLEKPGWATAAFNDASWAGVTVVQPGPAALVAQAGPPVRRIEEIKPVGLLHTPAGELVVDMGQNMVGWVRLKATGPAGTTVTLKHAEILDQQGNLYTANLRSAQQTDRFVLKGGAAETFEPHFTFHGFRYVAVEGYPGELSLEALTGIVIHSDMARTGHFECSNPLINQLQHNIVWGQKGNFLDVPTDCPQRDERMGWAGDAQVFSRTAAFNMNVAGFFTKWLKDVAADQRADGAVPHVIPDVLNQGGATGWADAAVIVPWNMYQCYGDTRLLAEQYDSMAAWIGYMRAQAGDKLIWNTGFHFGDWLAVPSPDPNLPNPSTSIDLLATAFFAYSTSLVQQAALVLGKTEDAARHADLLEQIKAAFCREFVTPSGRLGPNSQTSYVLALMFELLPLEQRAEAARRLAADVRSRGNHMTTGFLGASFLCPVLSAHGYLDVAFDLLEQEQYPGWLYPVTQGATTIWERWDGLKPDGTFQDVGMNSFNHYAYGAIGDWLYRVVAGIDSDPDAPGYKRIVFQPRPGGHLEYASASYDSLYGRIESGWAHDAGAIQFAVSLPPNTEAVVCLTARAAGDITEAGLPLSEVDGVTEVWQEPGQVLIRLGSGQYIFSVKGG